jgi:hypothetical protein
VDPESFSEADPETGARKAKASWLVGFSGDAFFNFDTSIFGGWDPSNQMCTAICYNLPQELLNMVADVLENTTFRLECIFLNFTSPLRRGCVPRFLCFSEGEGGMTLLDFLEM